MSLSAIVSALHHHAESAAASAHDAAPGVSPIVVWLIPLLPFFGFLFQTFIGRKLPKPVVTFVSCGVVLASCLISWAMFLKVRETGTPIVANLGRWISLPGLHGAFAVVADHKLVIDQLTSVMILVITNIGFLIHVYSTGYMSEEKRYARYFSYLNLFTGFMLILVMASNLLLMFVGWEGVGLCSYLLIGFWFEKTANAAAGMKAFVVNRVGDLAFTIGALTLFVFLGNLVDPATGKYVGKWSLDFGEIRETILAHSTLIPAGVATFIGIMLFIGATGKSAQMPLYVWLPDAMAGPTPVSALIHAATMVTAGVYMIARLNFLFSLSPTAMAVITGVGAFTALFAGTIGIAQNDIKKVLAYSTVSQLGFMFMAVGVGAYAAGVFHLFTHAFFKACLFLGSGSVIHGMGGEQDIRKMGGLAKKMPWTFGTFVIASLALSGVPFLAGFFSKDEILWKAWSTGVFAPTVLGHWYGKLIWLVGATAALCTAFYMTRLVIKTFLDRPKWGAEASFAGGGAKMPDWMDEDDKKPEPAGELPQDESMLDLGAVRKKPKEEPKKEPKKPEAVPPPPPAAAAHEDHGHAHDLPQDESMLDLGRVGRHAPKADAHDAHDAHGHAAPAAAHDAGHGHTDDAHGHGGGHHGEPHESPWSMLSALVILAAGSVFVGYLGVPHALGGSNAFETWLSPVTEPHAAKDAHAAPAHGTPVHEGGHDEHKAEWAEYALMLVSILAAFGGIGGAWYIYRKRSGVPAQDFVEHNKELYELVRDKYRVDEFYEAAVVGPLLDLEEGTCRFDNEIVDGAVNGAAAVARGVAKGTGLVDNEVVDAAVNGAAVVTQVISRKVRRAQTGNIKEYLTFALVGGLFVIALFCLWLTKEDLGSKISKLFGS